MADWFFQVDSANDSVRLSEHIYDVSNAGPRAGPYIFNSNLFVVVRNPGTSSGGFTDTTMQVWKSSDSGQTWAESDAANHPTTRADFGDGNTSLERLGAYAVAFKSPSTLYVAFVPPPNRPGVFTATATQISVTSFDLATETWGATVLTGGPTLDTGAGKNLIPILYLSYIGASDRLFAVLRYNDAGTDGTYFASTPASLVGAWTGLTQVAALASSPGDTGHIFCCTCESSGGGTDYVHCFFKGRSDQGGGGNFNQLNVYHRSIDHNGNLGTLQTVATNNAADASINLPTQFEGLAYGDGSDVVFTITYIQNHYSGSSYPLTLTNRLLAFRAAPAADPVWTQDTIWSDTTVMTGAGDTEPLKPEGNGVTKGSGTIYAAWKMRWFFNENGPAPPNPVLVYSVYAGGGVWGARTDALVLTQQQSDDGITAASGNDPGAHGFSINTGICGGAALVVGFGSYLSGDNDSVNQNWLSGTPYYLELPIPGLVPPCAVVPPPTCTLAAAPSMIPPGVAVTLTWTTAGAPDTAVIDHGVGSVNPAGGSTVVFPLATTTYTLTVTNAGGDSTCDATVTVSGGSGPGVVGACVCPVPEPVPV